MKEHTIEALLGKLGNEQPTNKQQPSPEGTKTDAELRERAFEIGLDLDEPRDLEFEKYIEEFLERSMLTLPDETQDAEPECEGLAARPLPSLKAPKVEPFPPDILPPTLRAFVYDVAERMSCQPDFVAVGGVVALGAALGNKLTIRPKARDAFSLPANLWGGVVGDPSQKKTPALAACMGPLYEIDRELQEAFKGALSEHANEIERHKLKLDKKKQEARKDGGFSYDPPAEPEQPPQKRLVVNDATSEKLGELAVHSPGGILLFRDELSGWMASLERAGREGERAFYLEGFNGLESFTSDRIGRGTIFIERLCLSLLGGIQPGPFREMLKADDNQRKADGLLQRFSLLTWPDPKPFEYVDRPPNREALDDYREAIRTLHSLNRESLDVGQRDDLKPMPFLRFTPEAQEKYIEWITALMHRIQPGQMPEAKAAHLAKYQKTLPALALLFELIENDRPTAVGLEAWERAEAWGNYLEGQLVRIYPTPEPGLTLAHTLAERWDSLPEEFTASEITKKDWKGLSDPEAVAEGLEQLTALNWLTSRTGTGKKGGRPTTHYRKAIQQPPE